MKILYKGKTSTYIGECECETVVMANKSEIDFFPPPASVPGSVRCPICGSSFFVYRYDTEAAKNIRIKYQNK